MKYQEKTFNSGANTKEYRENFDKVFAKDDIEFRDNEDGTVSFDMEVPEELMPIIEERAKEKNITIEESLSEMITEGLELMLGKEELKDEEGTEK
jgi:hypothetical protein